MPDLSFNTNAGQTIAREMLIVYLNTGTSASPVWSAVGKRVEDSSTEIDWDTETIRDKWKQEDMKKDVIPLPVTTSGEPDWDFMKDHMRQIEQTAENNLSALRKVIF